MKTSTLLLTSLALATASVSAHAGGPMPSGTFTVGAERMMGVLHADAKDTPPAPIPQQGYGITLITFLGNGGEGIATGNGGDPRYLHAIPRVGIDYFIIDGLSLGGSLTFVHASVSPDQGIGGSETGWLFAPRVGYAYMFSDMFGIWPRGGFSYAHDSVSPDDPTRNGASGHVFALDIDVPFLIAPVKNFAFTVGPIFDVTLGGSRTPDYRRADPVPPDVGLSMTMFGLSVGVVGIL